MQLSLITSLAEWEALAAEWNALLAESASNVPFLRHEYLWAWQQTLGGGEWPAGELRIAIARREDGALLGVAPLFQTASADGEITLRLLGSVEISDYLDVIARPADLPAFADALLAFLDSPQMGAWKTLEFSNLLDASPTLPELKRAADQKGWAHSEELLQHCPYIPLPGDWEKYLAEQVDKKQRHEIRRKMRRAEELGLPVRFTISSDPATLAADVDAFLALMANDPEKAAFLTASMRAVFQGVARAAFEHGWLQLAFLEIGGEKAAAYFNFDYDNRLWIYNSGLDFRFREYSPGWVLLGHLLQWANEQPHTVFDFMRGDEEYKYRFGAIDRRIVRLTIRRGAAA